MKYGFYLITGGGLILLRTAVMPYFPVFGMFYDVLIPFILYLSLCSPFIESLPVIIGCGFVMDSLSGGPFGIFSTSYVWIFIGMTMITKFVNISGWILLSLLTATGVLIENIIVFGAFGFTDNVPSLPENAFFILSVQLIGAGMTGTLILQCLKYLCKLWNKEWGIAGNRDQQHER